MPSRIDRRKFLQVERIGKRAHAEKQPAMAPLEMPLLDGFRKKYSENDLAVLGVNVGGSKELVEAFAKGLKITYPVLLDPAMIAAKMAPGARRPYFGFLGWPGHDRALWEKLKGDALARKFPCEHKYLRVRFTKAEKLFAGDLFNHP